MMLASVTLQLTYLGYLCITLLLCASQDVLHFSAHRFFRHAGMDVILFETTEMSCFDSWDVEDTVPLMCPFDVPSVSTARADNPYPAVSSLSLPLKTLIYSLHLNSH